MKSSERILKLTHSDIYCNGFKDSAQKKSTYFTRNRKMPFEELIIYMLLSLKCSTASALRRFFMDMGKKPVTMTQQSLSEARAKINVWAFIHLFKITVNVMTEDCVNKWHDYRIYAIDGSKIALPTEEHLGKYYGALGKDGSAPTAQGSVLYDVLNDIVADAAIEPLSTDERTLAKGHLDALKSISPNDKKLVMFDRGYASFEPINKLEGDGFRYLMRVRTKFNKDIDAQAKSDGYVWLYQDGKRIHVRVTNLNLIAAKQKPSSRILRISALVKMLLKNSTLSVGRLRLNMTL